MCDENETCEEKINAMTDEQKANLRVDVELVRSISDGIFHVFEAFDVDRAVGATALSIAVVRTAILARRDKASFLAMLDDTWEHETAERARKGKAPRNIEDQLRATLGQAFGSIGLKVLDLSSVSVPLTADKAETEAALDKAVSEMKAKREAAGFPGGSTVGIVTTEDASGI